MCLGFLALLSSVQAGICLHALVSVQSAILSSKIPLVPGRKLT